MRLRILDVFISIILLLQGSVTFAAAKSAAKLPTPEVKRWIVGGSLTTKQPTEPDAKTILAQDLGLGYIIGSGWSVGILEAYQSPTQVYEDSRQGFEDTEVSVDKIVGDFIISLVSIFPTSRTSQDASLLFGSALQGTYKYEYGRFGISLLSRIYAFAYTYETADSAGEVSNSPWAQFIGTTLSAKIAGGLGWFGHLDYYGARNYTGTYDGVTRGWTGFKYEFSKNFETQLYYRAQSAVLLNSSLYDEMKSYYMFSLVFGT